MKFCCAVFAADWGNYLFEFNPQNGLFYNSLDMIINRRMEPVNFCGYCTHEFPGGEARRFAKFGPRTNKKVKPIRFTMAASGSPSIQLKSRHNDGYPSECPHLWACTNCGGIIPAAKGDREKECPTCHYIFPIEKIARKLAEELGMMDKHREIYGDEK